MLHQAEFREGNKRSVVDMGVRIKKNVSTAFDSYNVQFTNILFLL